MVLPRLEWACRLPAPLRKIPRWSDKVVLAATGGRGLVDFRRFPSLPVLDGNLVHYTRSLVHAMAFPVRLTFSPGLAMAPPVPERRFYKEYPISEHTCSNPTINRAYLVRLLKYCLITARAAHLRRRSLQRRVRGVSGAVWRRVSSWPSWERGRSSISGKSGVNSYENVFVENSTKSSSAQYRNIPLFKPTSIFSDPHL